MAVQVERQSLRDEERVIFDSCAVIFIQGDGRVLRGCVDLVLEVLPATRPDLRLAVVVLVHGDAVDVVEEGPRGFLAFVVFLEARGERYVGIVVALLVRHGKAHAGAVFKSAAFKDTVHVELPALPDVDVAARPARLVVLHDGRAFDAHIVRVGGYVDAAAVAFSVVLGVRTAVDEHRRSGFEVNRAALFERVVLAEGAALDRGIARAAAVPDGAAVVVRAVVGEGAVLELESSVVHDRAAGMARRPVVVEQSPRGYQFVAVIFDEDAAAIVGFIVHDGAARDFDRALPLVHGATLGG